MVSRSQTNDIERNHWSQFKHQLQTYSFVELFETVGMLIDLGTSTY
jgi:hypothetical protein